MDTLFHFAPNVSVSLPSRSYSSPNTGALHSDKGDIGDLLSDIEPTVDPVSQWSQRDVAEDT